MKAIRLLLGLLDRSERRKLYLISCAVTIMAAIEVAGIASIMPFLTALSNPASARRLPFVADAARLFGATSDRGLLFLLGGGALALLVIRDVFSGLTAWMMARFAYMRNHTLSWRLLRSYLDQPYEYFLTRHTDDMGKNILSEVQIVVNGVVAPGILLVAQLVVAIAVLAFVVAIKPLLALGLMATVGLLFVPGILLARRILSRLGEQRVAANAKRFRAANDALGGIKEVKASGREDFFLRRFSEPSERFSSALATSQALGQVPRNILDLAAFGGILGVSLILVAQGRDLASLVPTLGLFALAAYRLMPVLQQVFTSFTSVRFNVAALEILHHDMLEKEGTSSHVTDMDQELAPWSTLSMSRVSYTYPSSVQPVIKELDFRLLRGEIVGLVGTSGSGKSTFVDLLLGLLRPAAGTLAIDDQPVSDDRMAMWRRGVGYVPQQSFLYDDTVTANVTFGLDEDDVDFSAVEEACRTAQIHDFIVEDLPNGYQTALGEAGIRLSGGQRQRIALARSIYRKPSLLVLDEATNALDEATESRVLHEISRYLSGAAVLIVSHRQQALKLCNRILLMQAGTIGASLTYDELAADDALLRMLMEDMRRE